MQHSTNIIWSKKLQFCKNFQWPNQRECWVDLVRGSNSCCVALAEEPKASGDEPRGITKASASRPHRRPHLRHPFLLF